MALRVLGWEDVFAEHVHAGGPERDAPVGILAEVVAGHRMAVAVGAAPSIVPGMCLGAGCEQDHQQGGHRGTRRQPAAARRPAQRGPSAEGAVGATM